MCKIYVSMPEVQLLILLNISVSKLSMFAGVLSLGVGDSVAAVSGTLIGRHKWPGKNGHIFSNI